MKFEEFVMEVDFPVHEFSKKFKYQMINVFSYDKIAMNGDTSGYNTHFDDPEYTPIIAQKFEEVVKDIFDVDEKSRPIKTWIYCQNNKRNKSVWHSHVNTCTVNGVFYIDPPKEGGGLQLFLNGFVDTIQPKKDKLYLFPYWMDHRPLPQEDDDWRISVNVEYFCRQRPIVKQTGIIW